MKEELIKYKTSIFNQESAPLFSWEEKLQSGYYQSLIDKSSSYEKPKPVIPKELPLFIEQVIKRIRGFDNPFLKTQPTNPLYKKLTQSYSSKSGNSDSVQYLFSDTLLKDLKLGYTKEFIEENFQNFKKALDKFREEDTWSPDGIFTLYRLSHPEYAQDILPFYKNLINQLKQNHYPFQGFEQAIILGLIRINNKDANELLKQFLTNFNYTDANLAPQTPLMPTSSISYSRRALYYLGKEHLAQTENWNPKQEAEFSFTSIKKRVEENDKNYFDAQNYMQLPFETRERLVDFILSGQGPDQDIFSLKQALCEEINSSQFVNLKSVYNLIKNRDLLAGYKNTPPALYRYIIHEALKDEFSLTFDQLNLFFQRFGIEEDFSKVDLSVVKIINSIIRESSNQSIEDLKPEISSFSLWLKLAEISPNSIKKYIVESVLNQKGSLLTFKHFTFTIYEQLSNNISLPGFEASDPSSILAFYEIPDEILEHLDSSPKLTGLLLTKGNNRALEMIKKLQTPEYWQKVNAFKDIYTYDLSKDQIYMATLFGWEAKSFQRLEQAYDEAFSANPLDIDAFDFSQVKPEQAEELISLINNPSIQKHLEQLNNFAKTKDMSLSKMITACISLDKFLRMVEENNFSEFASIPDSSILSFVEPRWFDLLLKAETANRPEEAGFQDLEKVIEEALDYYRKNGLESEDGVWSVNLSMRRDANLLEDQHVFLTIRNTPFGVRLSLEFKVREGELGNQELAEKMKWLGSMGTTVPDADPEIEKATEKLKEHWCAVCNNYEASENQLKDLGISQETFEKIKLKASQQISASEGGVVFLATEKVRHLKTSSRVHGQYLIRNTHSYSIRPDMEVYSATQYTPMAYRGYVRIDMSPEGDRKETANRLYGFLTLSGLVSSVARTSPDSEREYMQRRLEWHRKQPISSEESLLKLRWEEVYQNYLTYVQPDAYKTYENLGLRYFISTMRTKEGVAGALTLGTMSSNERRRRGIIRGGASLDGDISGGGADYAFLRTITKNVGSQDDLSIGPIGGGFVLIYAPELADRTDWFAYLHDNFGNTEEKQLNTRPTPEEYFSQLTNDYKLDNEICFKKGIRPDKIIGVLVQGSSEAESPESLIDLLKRRDITKLHGIPIEECIITGATVAHGEKLLEAYKKAKSQKTA